MILYLSAVPESPRGPLKISNITPQSCDLTWKSPDQDGGAPISEFLIEASADGETWVPLGTVDKFSNTYKVKDMEEGKKYTFRVSAVNKVGPSKPLTSDSIKAEKGPSAPEKPEGPLEVKDINKDSMTLSWQSPKSDGGSPITNYVIEKREPSRNLWTPVQKVKGDVTSCVADKLIEGKDYIYRVIAENKHGQSKPLESEQSYKAKSPYGRCRNYCRPTVKVLLFLGYQFSRFSWAGKTMKLGYQPKGDFH